MFPLSFGRIVKLSFRTPPFAPLYFLILYARRFSPSPLPPPLPFLSHSLSLSHTHIHTLMQRRTPSYRVCWASHIEYEIQHVRRRRRRAGRPLVRLVGPRRYERNCIYLWFSRAVPYVARPLWHSPPLWLSSISGSGGDGGGGDTSGSSSSSSSSSSDSSG